MVVFGFAAVDDDVGGAALGGEEGEVGGGIDGEGGAEGEDEVGVLGGAGGALEVFLAEALAEADGRGFEEAAAMAAGRFAGLAEGVEVGAGFGHIAAALAGDPAVGAMDFDESFAGGAGEFVEAIDVLGYDGLDASRGLEAGDGEVGGVGARGMVALPGLQFEIPVFDARGLGGHEVVVVDGLAGFPDALGAAEVGDAAAGGDPGAREDEDPAGGLEVLDQGGVGRGRHGSRSMTESTLNNEHSTPNSRWGSGKCLGWKRKGGGAKIGGC